MKWKLFSYICFFLVIPLLVKWYADCRDLSETIIFSKDKKAIVTKTVDPLFGSEVSSTQWKKGFWLGLLPGDDSFSYKALLGVFPIGGILIIAGGAGLFMNFRQKKKKKTNINKKE
jgi:hypothetical protein